MGELLNTFKRKSVVTNMMNKCALSVAEKTVNLTCGIWSHQPKVPEEAKRLRKF